MSQLIRSGLLAATMAAAILSSNHARASKSARDAKEKTARKACLAGDYAKGVEILSGLFVDSEDPTYIFNQGRCFEQNRRYEDAIGRFQEFLRVSPNLSTGDRAPAEGHIAECQKLLDKQNEKLAPPSTPPPTASESSFAGGVVAPSRHSGAAEGGQVSNPPPRSRHHTVAIVAASAGVVAVAAGVILNLKVNSMADDMQNTPGAYSDNKESDRKTYATLGWVGYGVGAACIVTGVVLFLTGRPSSQAAEASHVALVPTVGIGQGGATLAGAF
jgi:hypothetical protein